MNGRVERGMADPPGRPKYGILSRMATPKKSPAIDAYIAKAKPFAQPILKHLRRTVHAACPDVVEEVKWGVPHFAYKGMFCGMAAFKEHCTFGFWKQSLLGTEKRFDRITSIEDLPSDAELARLIKRAKKLNDDGITAPKRKITPVKDRVVTVPPAFMKAIKANKKAAATFQAFPYSKKKDYVEWITEAKAEDTRARRMATAVEWMAEGKSRNWKYENC
jgi:hypothetical protein